MKRGNFVRELVDADCYLKRHGKKHDIYAATYIGPAVSPLRSPFGWRITAALGIADLFLLVSLAHVGARLVSLEAIRADVDAFSPSTLLQELLQPLRW